MIDKIYYFAYGSNIKQERLEFRVGKVKYVSNHILLNYRLVFNCGNRFGDVFANIVKSNGDKVHGCLYELTPLQLSLLDGYELLYYKEFFMIDNQLCVVYISYPKFILTKNVTPPWLNYINIILEGCVEKKLTYTYNEVLAFKKANYRLKKGNKFKRN